MMAADLTFDVEVDELESRHTSRLAQSVFLATAAGAPPESAKLVPKAS